MGMQNNNFQIKPLIVPEGPVKPDLAERVLLQPANEANNLGRDTALDVLSRQYAGCHGDTINHVINTIEALRSPNYQGRMQEVADNLLTSIIEKLNADAQGRFSYNSEWRGPAGLGQMYFNNRPAIEIYRNAVNEANGQIPEFEIARNQANAANLDAMQTLKNQGSQGFFIELSPSPVITDEAKKRGYDGRDSIFVYDLSGNKSIAVDQHWFKKTDAVEYYSLMDDMRHKQGVIIGPDKDIVFDDALMQKFPDAKMMHNYIYLPDRASLEPILNFIKTHQKHSSTEAAKILATETPALRKKVNDLLPELVMTARGVIDNPDLKLDSVLEYLARFVSNEQFELKTKFLKEANFNTFSQELQKFIVNGLLDEKRARHEFKAEGCGFSIAEAVKNAGQRKDMPSNVKSIPISGKVFDAHDASVCPNCNQVFYVKNGDTASYYETCPYCHSDKVSCK